jgi:hypothetical protein
MGRDTYQAPSPALNLTAITSTISWTTRPKLAWNFIPAADPGFHQPHFTSIRMRRSPEADFEVGGRRYGLFTHDWRVEPVSVWLSTKAEREMQPDLTLEQLEAALPRPLLVLSQPEFEESVRQALGDCTRPALLAANPLMRSRLVIKAVGSFAELAVASGVGRLVLLSGRGEREAELAEQAVRGTGADWTILRSTWFSQNFSEDHMLAHVLSGEVALPAGNTPEPFVDADDIADVAVAALTDDRHVGQLYELTGPRLLTFAQAVEEIAEAAGREVRYLPVSIEQHTAAAAEQGVPREAIGLLTYHTVRKRWRYART